MAWHFIQATTPYGEAGMARLSPQMDMNIRSHIMQFDKHRAVNLSRINEATHNPTEIP